MLTLFKKLMPGTPEEESTPTAARLRMSLPERKAYRREMLYQSIRECLLGLEALSSMYKFRVVNVDERHHRFIAMIEVTGQFQARKAGVGIGFPQIEAIIRRHAFERYGVVLERMFWRVDESTASYTRARRADDTPQTRIKPQTPMLRQATRRYARHPYAPVTEKEREQFTNALRQGQRPPPIRVGTQEYASDIAPLESTTEVGGTQYGQL